LEYILRNTLLSVVEMPNATMLMVPEMLGNDRFRAKVIERVTDPVLKSFWLNEFNMYSDKMRTEAVSPIQNKVGQFLSSTVIRNILKNPKSTLDIRKCMDEGKIILLNLSQGRLGEDNAALLGAMIITKIQLAAMSRVNIPESERRDFYLYVDEFQNFATSSFIKILSEARKYRLNLILANQYIDQIEEDVRSAIFGNAGTLMSFLVGATDATYLAKEYKERFTEEDLLALGNYRAIVKLAIDNVTMPPFLCYSLPLPRSVTQAKEKVLRNSIERYTRPVKEMTLTTKMNDQGELVDTADTQEAETPADKPATAPANKPTQPAPQKNNPQPAKAAAPAPAKPNPAATPAPQAPLAVDAAQKVTASAPEGQPNQEQKPMPPKPEQPVIQQSQPPVAQKPQPAPQHPAVQQGQPRPKEERPMAEKQANKPGNQQHGQPHHQQPQANKHPHPQPPRHDGKQSGQGQPGANQQQAAQQPQKQPVPMQNQPSQSKIPQGGNHPGNNPSNKPAGKPPIGGEFIIQPKSGQ
jgi:hypothetical protein